MREWRQHPLDHIFVDYINDNDLFKLKVTMIGPKGTPYFNGKYILNVTLSDHYPMHGMSIKFITKIYCCNVSDDGMISTDLFGDNWNTKCNIKQTLQIIYNKCFIQAGDYDYNCVLRTDLNKLLYKDTQQFVINALKYNHQFAGGVSHQFYTFPQLNKSQYIQHLNAIKLVINKYTILSMEIIENHLIDYCLNYETECDLFEFIFKFQNKKKYQGEILNISEFEEREKYEFKIKLKTISGDMHTLNVNSNDTIYFIKQLMAMKLKFPLKQHLLFNSKQLDDGQTLQYYNIKDNDMLHLVQRCQGG